MGSRARVTGTLGGTRGGLGGSGEHILGGTQGKILGSLLLTQRLVMYPDRRTEEAKVSLGKRMSSCATDRFHYIKLDF